jgi:hypothetical protein
MSVPINGPGAGGSGVMAPTPSAAPGAPWTPPPPDPTAASPYTGLLAAYAAQKQQSDEDKKQAGYAAAEKQGMGLLGQAVTPAPTFKGGGAQVVVPRQPGVPMPDFVQMLAQQRLMRSS